MLPFGSGGQHSAGGLRHGQRRPTMGLAQAYCLEGDALHDGEVAILLDAEIVRVKPQMEHLATPRRMVHRAEDAAQPERLQRRQPGRP